MSTKSTDILIIGTGLAGFATALKVSSFAKVVLIAKDKVDATNTSMAQGGIAAVMATDDSFESHERDTYLAGAGLCDEGAVQNILRQAPERIKDLIDWGVHFNLREGSADSHDVDLTREGGHSSRRILHFEDQTGAEIQKALWLKIKENPNIEVLDKHFSIDLIMNKQVDPYDMSPTKCVGAYILDKATGQVTAYKAKTTILATGGAGKVYLYTANWSGATGDGIAMAYKAGARIANLEFMQFHPTCLFHRDSRNFLISEALRGEGGILINDQGEDFMRRYHPLGSLAPRDIVARSIDAEMKKSGAPCVYLKMTHLSSDYLKQRFPAIYNKCLEYQIDLTQEPIPVVPAAHYLCGGVLTDVCGQTDVPGLFAIGETACTGLHGANRLASNSLLECVAMAHNASEVLQKNWNDYTITEQDPPAWVHPAEADADEMIVIHHMWEEVRRLMWNYVGIVRSKKRLNRAKTRLDSMMSEVTEYYSNFKVHSDIIELRNIVLVAMLSVKCAMKRKESRGIHFNIDTPSEPIKDPLSKSQTKAEDTILLRGLN